VAGYRCWFVPYLFLLGYLMSGIAFALVIVFNVIYLIEVPVFLLVLSVLFIPWFCRFELRTRIILDFENYLLRYV
jgi:hypothetical protein